MMTTNTKRYVAAALDELKRDGYMVLCVMMDKKADESQGLGGAMEIIFSESNDPNVVAAMAKNALKIMSSPQEPPCQVN